MFVLNQNNVYFEQIHKININKRLKLIKKKKSIFIFVDQRKLIFILLEIILKNDNKFDNNRWSELF